MDNLIISILFIKGDKFMDNMREMRKKREDGKYDLTLEIGDGAYFGTYEDVDLKSGEDLVRNYLRNNSDDANLFIIKILFITFFYFFLYKMIIILLKLILIRYFKINIRVYNIILNREITIFPCFFFILIFYFQFYSN